MSWPRGICSLCQIAQEVNGVWKCVKHSDICSPSEDFDTFHRDGDTGKWACCLKGFQVRNGRCVQPPPKCPPPPAPTGLCKSSVCAKAIQSSKMESHLRQAFAECFPHDELHFDSFVQYQLNSLDMSINLFEKIYQDEQRVLRGRQPQSSSPAEEWSNCSPDKSPCKWLSLENNSNPKRLAPTGHEKMTLPNPTKQLSHYVYPFDTWVTKVAEGDLTLYINGKKVMPHSSGVDFLIPAGTVADDVLYKSQSGTMILFYGSCSSDRPCVGRELVPWTRGVSDKRFGQEGEIDVEHYDTDLVLTIADTENTSEKYTVYADGKEIGSTHGRLTLGKDKYKRDHTNRVNVGSGAAGALRSIANDGVWGSFKIPRGTRKITISDEDSDYDFAFEYRLDEPCACGRY
ncbi:hypothetical protein BBK36DRAFT_1172439 [Trichoderma citrinoviride]|uniref:Uncharacterized protein n=1 Tax=Trichoderma citrinoviride TaxID=58853 RepID=A0A2T4B031_9HYPO|nr:hypothetical protein BBK36DRAFT_1172439 [Trichoderma citrinoviride]PTB62684.1 hypothetical protein BBK36DRAFT_1172439 [Trichoderma citrinoviride]